MRKSFHSINVIGELPQTTDKSLILLTNHSSWWDGFFTYLINKKIFNKKFHILMLEDQLKRYWFFNYLGAYSIDQNNPKKIVESLSYSSELTAYDNNLINIYPEGKMGYSFKNKVDYKLGIDKILRSSHKNSNVIQCAIKIVSLNDQYPHVFFKFSEIHKNTISSKELENEMNTLLDEIDENIDNFTELFSGTKSK